MPKIKIVARFNDGRLLKGTTDNFSPESPSFHLTPTLDQPDTTPICVNIDELKAVFVVHTFKGKPGYEEREDFSMCQSAVGAKLEVQFNDGETMLGHSMNFDLTSQGFFLFPADPESNNQRIFVVSNAVKAVNRVA